MRLVLFMVSQLALARFSPPLESLSTLVEHRRKVQATGTSVPRPADWTAKFQNLGAIPSDSRLHPSRDGLTRASVRLALAYLKAAVSWLAWRSASILARSSS